MRWSRGRLRLKRQNRCFREKLPFGNSIRQRSMASTISSVCGVIRQPYIASISIVLKSQNVVDFATRIGMTFSDRTTMAYHRRGQGSPSPARGDMERSATFRFDQVFARYVRRSSSAPRAGSQISYDCSPATTSGIQSGKGFEFREVLQAFALCCSSQI